MPTFELLISHTVIERFSVEAENLSDAGVRGFAAIVDRKLKDPEPCAVMAHLQDYQLVQPPVEIGTSQANLLFGDT